MKLLLLSFFVFITNLLSAQAENEEVNKFIALFKSQIAKLDIGKIEEHYDQGYFKVLSESEYFDKDVEIGISTIFQKCVGKDEMVSKQEINRFFEQHKKLKTERKAIDSKMNDFSFMQSFLKIRIYSDYLKPQYENHAIVKKSYKGMIEVVVLDLPSGIGSLEKKYLDIWKKSENDIYSLARENTIKALNQKFEKAETGKDGEEFYLLASDTDLFITSSILELKKTNLPVGKYGTLVSIPNNMVIVALPLDDLQKINGFSLTFRGLTDYMHGSDETKPVSNNLFWFNGKEMAIIEKDIEKKELIYPDELKKIMGK